MQLRQGMVAGGCSATWMPATIKSATDLMQCSIRQHGAVEHEQATEPIEITKAC